MSEESSARSESESESRMLQAEAVVLEGVGGGMAGGALAGLTREPGAPFCVVDGSFAGNVLAALGVEFVW